MKNTIEKRKDTTRQTDKYCQLIDFEQEHDQYSIEALIHYCHVLFEVLLIGPNFCAKHPNVSFLLSLDHNITLILNSSVCLDGKYIIFVNPKRPAKAIYGFAVVVLEMPVVRVLVGTITI